MNTIDPYYILYVGVFIGALLAYEGLRQGLSRGEHASEAKSRRMRMLNAGATPHDVLLLLRPPQNTGLLARLPFIAKLPQRMRQAGITMKPQVFLLLCGAGAVAVYVAANGFFGPLGAMAAAFGAGFLVPVAVVDSLRRKRTQKLIAQLPDALDLMARGLRVGHPLNTTIASVASEMPDPIGTEFGLILDQVSYGEDIVTAFKEMAERVDEEDTYYLAVSIGIQHGTGGNLGRLLGVLSKVIRDRATMRRKIKAISAEGRTSMWILSSLPLAIFGFVNFTAPDFYGGVSGDPLFLPMMAIVATLSVVNFLILRKLVAFKF